MTSCQQIGTPLKISPPFFTPKHALARKLTLYDSLFHNLETPKESYASGYWGEFDSYEVFLKEKFGEEIYKRIIEAEEADGLVYMGTWSNDSGDMKSFLCCDCFVIEKDHLYFNGAECAW